MNHLRGFGMDLFRVLTLGQRFTMNQQMNIFRVTQKYFSEKLTARKNRDQTLDDARIFDKIMRNGLVSTFE